MPGELFPISAQTGAGVEALVDAARRAAARGAVPSTRRTSSSDQPLELRLAELVREQALLRTREEVPHAVEVEIDEIEEREDGLLVVRARVWAETESQKGILVGAGGRMVRAVGTAARKEIERAARPPRPPGAAGARAQGLAPRRGRCSTASASSDLERIRGSCATTEEGVVRRGRDRPRHGTALLTPEPAARLAAERDPRGGPGRRRPTSSPPRPTRCSGGLGAPQAGRARRAARRAARAGARAARAGTSSAC